MNFVALKMLIGDRLKYLGLVAGLTFAVMLITQQAAIFSGFMTRMGAFIRDTAQGDLWVTDPQLRFSEDQKPLRDTALQRVRSVEGVAWAVPMYKGWLKCRLPDGTVLTVIVIGLDDATLMGGPPRMVEGRLADLKQDAAILIDAEEADKKMRMEMAGIGGRMGVRLGDRLSFNEQEAVITGTFRASRAFFWDPVIYTTYSRALRFAPHERRQLSYVLVKAREGVEPAEVARRITAATGLKAHTNRAFERISTEFMLRTTGILVNFGMAIGLGFVIGVLIAGQTLYSFTLDNLRHFGALKAMGATNLTLVRMVCVQVLAVSLIGYGLGLGVASLIGKAVTRAGLAFKMGWEIPALAGGALLVIGVIAGLLSIVKVVRLEPAIVFKG